MVFRETEPENEGENVREEDKAEFEEGRFLEGATEFDSGKNFNPEGIKTGCEAYEGAEKAFFEDCAEDPEKDRDEDDIVPEVKVDDSAEDIDVINRNQGFPARFAGFLKNLPPSNNH